MEKVNSGGKRAERKEGEGSRERRGERAESQRCREGIGRGGSTWNTNSLLYNSKDLRMGSGEVRTSVSRSGPLHPQERTRDRPHRSEQVSEPLRPPTHRGKRCQVGVTQLSFRAHQKHSV